MKKRNERDDSQAKQRLALAVFAYLEPKAVQHVFWRRVAVSAILTVLLIAGAWVAGNVLWASYEVEGEFLSAKSPDAQLERAVEQNAKAYRLQILRPDGVLQEFSLQDMGMRVHINSSVLIARQKQRKLTNRLRWWQPVPIQLAISADEKALEAFVTNHATIIVEPARDASLSIVDGIVQLSDAVNGKQYGLTNPAETVLAAASKLQSNPLKLKIVSQEPLLTNQALAETKQNLEKILQQSLVFTIGDETVRAGPKDIAGWITLSTDLQKKTVITSVNPDAVRSYVNQIANARNRPPKAQVALSSGTIIPGNPGIAVTNTATAADTVTQTLLLGKGIKVDLPVRRTPFRTVSVPTEGKWIEIDLTNKRMYAFIGATQVRSFLISAGAPATPTVTGTFAIYSKFASQTMSGPNADGSRYVQPNVPWVNYFYRDYAIHGNYWRPTSYFGNVNSSHGCVGLLTGDGAWVYSWAPIGTPVVVHY